jgi:hypothetical protein
MSMSHSSFKQFKQKLHKEKAQKQRAKEIQARWETFDRKIRGIYDTDEITDKPDVITPIVKWILFNFEELRDSTQTLIGDGTGFKNYDLSYPRGRGGQSVTERYVIGAEKCRQIIDAVQGIIDELESDMFDILVKYFWDGLPAWKVAKTLQAEEVKISERTVKRQIQDIYSLVIDGLKDADIDYYNLYWFRLRFEFIGQNRGYKGCSRNKQNNKDAA